MKCVICKGEDIKEKEVEEEIRIGNDIVLVLVKIMVCSSCGERYYDRRTMKMLEEIEAKIEKEHVGLETVGKVLKVTEIDAES